MGDNDQFQFIMYDLTEEERKFIVREVEKRVNSDNKESFCAEAIKIYLEVINKKRRKQN